MNKGLCSVIVPFYNGADYIENTVKSILASDYVQIEVIIVDDGSSDQKTSQTVLDRIASLDQRVFVYYKSNGGVADARNFGLRQANGEYIAFCDQDDLVAVNQYSRLIEMMENHNSDLVVSSCYCVEGKIKKQNAVISHTCCLEKAGIRELQKWMLIGETYSYDGIKIPSVIWNCMFKNQIIRDHSIVLKSYLQYDDDYNFLLQYLSACSRIYITEQAFYTWFIRSSSQSHNKRSINGLVERYEAFLKFKESFKGELAITDQEWDCFVKYYHANQLCAMIKNEATKCKSFHAAAEACSVIRKNSSAKLQMKYDPIVAAQIKNITGKRNQLTYWCSTHSLNLIALGINI